MGNVVQRLQAFNVSRDPQLLQLKYKAMRMDAFAFYRGTCHLFYEDWPADAALNAAPSSWLCGDLHWQNFGSYKGDNRLVYFNINDFDEAALAPCTWDLARLLVSIWVGAHTLAMNETLADAICRYFLAIYTRTLMRGRVRSIEEDQTSGIVHDLIFQVKTRNRAIFLNSRTVVTNGQRSLIIDGKHALAATEEERLAVLAFMQQWGAQQLNPQFFTPLDVARRIAGIGSLGVERYVILVEGNGSPNQNYLLDLKSEITSSLQPYLILRQPQWKNDAERAVTIQHWMQNVPPALLESVTLHNTSFVLRELQPTEDKVNSTLLNGKASQLEKLVKTLAQVVAWGELRSAGRQGADDAHDLISFASKSKWQNLLLAYAHHYAQTVKQDYAEFCQAYDKGLFGLPMISVSNQPR
jgi:uncharacterized protein (DUF2252 family)